jgi:hypothetical protein
MIRNINFLTKWVADLRSGKYKQCKLCLKRQVDEEFRYCCLGVAYDIQYPHGWASYDDLFTNEGEKFYLSAAFREFVGLTEAEVLQLGRLNDVNKFSFEQIADYIEKNFIRGD